MEPTPEELKWFKRIERVIKDMPDSVWLFANSAGLSMMRKDAHGHHATIEMYGPVGGGMDHDYLLESIDCNIDGGDW